MEGREKDREHKIKMKKKRKLGRSEEEELLNYSDVKKKKKRKRTDEDVKKGKEGNEDTHTLDTKRKRKESETESDWSVRHKSNTELIKVRALNRQEEAKQENELVTHKRKKKKKKKMCEMSSEDSGASDHFAARKKKKKKKTRKPAEGTEILPLSTECSFIAPPVAENGGKDTGGGEEGREKLPSPVEHTFLKPFPVQDKRRGRGGEKVMKEGKRQEESCYYRPQRMKEGRIPDKERGKGDSHIDQRKDIEEGKNKVGTRGLSGVTSRLAYSGMLGWETDTSVDDLDYSDDLYHQPQSAIRERMRQARMGSTPQGCVIYSEGEEIEGFVPDPRYSSDNESNEWTAREVPPTHRSSPGFVVQQREIPTLEEALYKFPPGVGISPEEVEEVQEAEDYWVMKEKALQTSSFAEEAKEYIDNKIQQVEDYFERLLEDNLSPSEMKETRPENFDGPYYPTPRQLQFLDTLNIKVDWPLSDLHQYYLTHYTLPHKKKAEWHALNLFADTSRLTLREEKIIARNWFAFQKEYNFYDLRPLVSVRTGRVMREAGQVFVQPYEYLSRHNKVHFLLYLAKDLPTRTLEHIERKIQKLLPFLRGRCLMRKCQRASGLMLAKLLYVMEIFGADMLAAELLIGQSLKSFFHHAFLNHIMLQNVKLRIGPWRQDENERFLRGLQEVMRVRTFEEAYRLRRVPWMSIFPYVRTRSVAYMRRRLIVLASRNGEKDNPSVARRNMADFIRLLYNKQVDDFTYLDWESLAREVGANNPIRLVWFFRKVYFNGIPYNHRITVPEGLRYMYKHMIPFYENTSRNRISLPGHLDYQNLLFDPDPSNPSGSPNTHSNEPMNPDSDSDNATIEPSLSGDPCGPNDSNSKPDDPRTNMDDHSTPRMGHKNQQHDARKYKKVTKKQNDLSNSRKAKNPHDLSDPRNVTFHDLPNSSKSTQQDHSEDDPSASVFPDQCDPEDNPMSCDLSDSDDDLTSDSDSCDFECVTLGQALRRSVDHVRKNR